MRVREERSAGPARTAAAEPASEAQPDAPVRREGRKRTPPKRSAKGGNLEQQIEAAEATLRAIEDELADPGAWATPDASARSTARHEQARRAVAELYERWEAVAG